MVDDLSESEGVCFGFFAECPDRSDEPDVDEVVAVRADAALKRPTAKKRKAMYVK